MSEAPLDAAGIYSVKGVSGLLSSRGVIPKDSYPLLAYAGDWRRAEAAFARIADRQKNVCDGSMDHRAFVEAICCDRPARPAREPVGSVRRAT